jgi:hypothetical protein
VQGLVCDTMHLRFDEGGPWDGWVRLGKKNKFNADAYCGLDKLGIRVSLGEIDTQKQYLKGPAVGK